MSTLLRHISRNLPPYQYKEAIEQMYADMREFDEICNAEFLPAFEDTNNGNANTTDSDTQNDDDSNSGSGSSVKVDLTNKNATNPKQKKDPIIKKDMGFGEKLKAIAKALAEMIKKIMGWFAEKIGKIDFADEKFLENLDNAKDKGIQNVEITTYDYHVDIIRKCVTSMDQDFEKFDNEVKNVFDKYSEASVANNTDSNDVANTITAQNLDMLDDQLKFKNDYFKILYTTKFGLKDNKNEVGDTAESFAKKWESVVRGEKITQSLNSQNGHNLVNNAETFLRQGFESLIKTLKHGISNVENSQKNVSNLISSAIRNDVSNREANAKMTTYLNSYNQYLSFVSMFYKTAYNITVEARTNFKLLLQRAYNF